MTYSSFAVFFIKVLIDETHYKVVNFLEILNKVFKLF